MKRLATILLSILPGAAFAHIVPGEIIMGSERMSHAHTQAHGSFHTEYIFIVLALIAVLYAVKLVRNK
jgi:hypothetical protein